MKTRKIALTAIAMFSFLGAIAGPSDSTAVKDTTLTLPYQFTFIPPIGTNGLMSSKTTHYLSINAIAGYNGGVKGLEVGGFANVLEYNMKGSQLAGFANVVRGNTSGFQAAGFSNYVHGTTDGIQAAGFTNHSNLSSRALQAAGFSNQVLGSVIGAQVAGFANVCTDSLTGLQAAGFANYSGDRTLAVQAAGFANVAKGMVNGAQVAGFANTAVGDLNGTQISGFGNACGDLDGVQISGFVNLAKKVRGSQLGFINVADSFAHGAPIGFLSFVKNGYRNYSFGVNELGWAEFQFRTGVDRFYNTFALALNPVPSMSSWAYGYGIGTKVLNTGKSHVTLDLLGYDVQERELYTDAFNMLFRFSARYEYHPKAERFAIWGSPSVNLQQSSKKRYEGGNFKSDLAPYSIMEANGKHLRSKFWVGAQVGVSF